MLRLLLVDDEPLARRALRQLLDTRDDVEVVAECADVEAMTPWLGVVDGILLDIEMPKQSGLDFARAQAAQPLPALVFVTAFDRYAVPAFATDALDYLCKPVTAIELDRAITRLREHVAYHRSRLIAPTAHTHDYLLARTGRTEERIRIADVECVEADDVYAAVYVGAKRWLVRHSLATLLSMLPSDFLRVHRSWIVPRRAVRAIRRSAQGPQLLLHSGRVIPISRRNARAVRAWLFESSAT
jgi:two-component system LytT family response regulator